MSKIGRPAGPQADAKLDGEASKQTNAGDIAGIFAAQFSQANRQFAEMATMLTSEVMDFASRRMQAQVEFVGELPHCRDMQGMMDAQLRFLARTSKDYAEEVSHVGAAVRRLAAGQAEEAKAE